MESLYKSKQWDTLFRFTIKPQQPATGEYIVVALIKLNKSSGFVFLHILQIYSWDTTHITPVRSISGSTLPSPSTENVSNVAIKSYMQ